MAEPATFTGDKELERVLLKLPERVQSRVLKSAIRVAGKPIVKSQRSAVKKKVGRDAQGRFTSDETSRSTGNLAKSVGTSLKTFKGSGNTVLFIGPRKGFVAPNGEEAAKYGIGIERGWRNRTPIPFMRQSFEAGKSTVVRDFQKGIGDKIEREAVKLAGEQKR